MSPEGSVHMVDRRAKLNVEVPYLLKKLMGVEYLLFRQRNTKDLAARTLRIEAWNESFESRVEINEYCVYSVHPENPNWTCFEQSAQLDIKNFFGFEGTAEKIAIREYSKSIEKSKDIMEHFITKLAEMGITEVPPWVEPAGVVNLPEQGQEVQVGPFYLNYLAPVYGTVWYVGPSTVGHQGTEARDRTIERGTSVDRDCTVGPGRSFGRLCPSNVGRAVVSA